jgi:hypothetical protein
MSASTPAFHAQNISVAAGPRRELCLAFRKRNSVGFTASVADGGIEENTSDVTRLASYQLQRYATSPLRNDPYFPGSGDHCDTAAKLIELNAALLSLQKGHNASKF